MNSIGMHVLGHTMELNRHTCVRTYHGTRNSIGIHVLGHSMEQGTQ